MNRSLACARARTNRFVRLESQEQKNTSLNSELVLFSQFAINNRYTAITNKIIIYKADSLARRSFAHPPVRATRKTFFSKRTFNTCEQTNKQTNKQTSKQADYIFVFERPGGDSTTIDGVDCEDDDISKCVFFLCVCVFVN